MADVFKELKYLSERYAKLLSLFREFHKGGKSLVITHPPQVTYVPIPGIIVGDIEEDRYFDVSFAGTTARFVFSLLHLEAGGIRGQVTVYRVEPLDTKLLEHVDGFEYDGQGDTGQKSQHASTKGDPILVGTPAYASQLIADLLHKTILKPPLED